MAPFLLSSQFSTYLTPLGLSGCLLWHSCKTILALGSPLDVFPVQLSQCHLLFETCKTWNPIGICSWRALSEELRWQFYHVSLLMTGIKLVCDHWLATLWCLLLSRDDDFQEAGTSEDASASKGRERRLLVHGPIKLRTGNKKTKHQAFLYKDVLKISNIR